MTVRWKPLIVMSGLFLVIAALGLIAFAILPSDSRDLVAQARAEWKAKKYDRAYIQFERARQKDGKNPDIHEQMARMYAEWAQNVPAKRVELRARRLRSLAEAAKYGRQRTEPRRQLLLEALKQEDLIEALDWAKQLQALDAKDPDARYVLALDALSAQPPQVAEARKHLEVLVAKQPDRPRTAWIKAGIAQETGDDATVTEVLGAARGRALSDKDDPIDSLALLRLRMLDVRRTTDPAVLTGLVASIKDDAGRLASDPEPAPNRIALLGRMLDQLQSHLGSLTGDAKEKTTNLADAVGKVAESVYRQAIDKADAPDPRSYLSYSEHLLLRERRDECLQAVAKGLALPAVNRPAWQGVAMSLREVGVKAALLDPKDPKRYDKAAPFLKELMASTDPTFQGVGHLFQGVIDLEQSGLAEPPSPKANSGESRTIDRQRQSSALSHLKTAAADLPRVPAAQALYGVALMLSREPALGRQYLQAARRLGNLEPRYQVWAAWSMIQAGYPEDAQPIVSKLFEEAPKTAPTRNLEPMLHMLQGEIYQASNSPADLRKAREEYQKAVVAGQIASPALQMRMAQIEVRLGEREAGSRRIATLRAAKSGPAAEVMSVLLLKDQKKHDDARRVLGEARRRYPDSDELVGLDATMLVEQGQSDRADAVLAEFLAKYPGHLDVRLARARLLAGPPLNKPDEACKLLAEVADGDNSAPLVQLALIRLQQRDYPSASQTIAKIRARWKEAAAADLLDAQLALAQENPRAAAKYLDEALRKDPTNKVALFWKAQIDERTGAAAEAAQVFEAIAKENSTKELVGGLSLAQAAEWSLASMALENQDVDNAITRFQGLLKTDISSTADRQVRWQLAVAQAAKGQWPAARAAVETLLKDPKTTLSERVQAANFFRVHDDPAAANAQLDIVLKERPDHPQAVASRALMLAGAGKTADAVALIQKALSLAPQPPSLYLMLAATENLTPPASDALARTRAALDLGLKAYPQSIELVRANYLAMKMAKDPAALAFVEAKAKADPKGPFRRLLIDTYRDEGDLAKSEQTARELVKAEPDDARLATTLVALVAARAIEAGRGKDPKAEQSFYAEAQSLIRKFRAAFPNDPTFPQAECELAARRGDLDRAVALTQDLDKLDRNSPIGPLLRAQIYAARGANWIGQEVQAYSEAASRSPRRADIRIALAKANLKSGRVDEAIRQTDLVLEARPGQMTALLLKAHALSIQEGTSEQVDAHREQAIQSLRAVVTKGSKATDVYHEIARIERLRGRRTEALAALKEGLKAAPEDDTGLAMLIQFLTEPRDKDQGPAAADVQEAMKLAETHGSDASDKTGTMALAIALGFHQSGQFDLALPWAEKATAKLDRPIVQLTFGDILLAKAEATTDPSTARATFQKALAAYDRVLKGNPDSIEATNNKAWILHRYLNDNASALELAEGLARRADAESLPPEFLDTLGAIQEAMGRTKVSEETYARGLRKAPGFAMLNYHMGKLLASDPARVEKAVPYLDKALAGRGGLPSAVAMEVEALLKRARGQ